MRTALHKFLPWLAALAGCGASQRSVSTPCEAPEGAVYLEHRGDPNAVEPLVELFLDGWELHSEANRPPCADCDDERNPDSDLEYAEGIVDTVASAIPYALVTGLDVTPLVDAARAINLALGAGLFFQHHSEDFDAFDRAAREVRREANRGLEALDAAFQRALQLHSTGEGDVARQVACLGARANAYLDWSGLAASLDHRGMMLSEAEGHALADADLAEDQEEAESRRAHAEELLDDLDEISELTNDAVAVTSILEDLDSPLDHLQASMEGLRQRDYDGWAEAVGALDEVLRACGAS